MSQSDYNQLLQTAIKRELNNNELDQIQDLLDRNPNEMADFDAVDQLLTELPNVRVSNNFTSLVMNEACREISLKGGADKFASLSWLRFFTSQYRPIQWMGFASLCFFMGILIYESRLSQDRLNMLESVQLVADLTEIAPELLVDFEMINAINHSDPIDEELWAALK